MHLNLESMNSPDMNLDVFSPPCLTKVSMFVNCPRTQSLPVCDEDHYDGAENQPW